MKRRNSDAIVWAIVSVILLVLAFVAFILLGSKETRVSETYEKDPIMALECNAGSLSDSFYTSNTADTIQNGLKLTYKKQKIDKLFYTFTGAYSSNEAATQDEAILHAKYNIYLGENNVRIEDLVPTYSINKNKLIMTLYADQYAMISPITAVFFFIDVDEISELGRYSIEEAKTYYEAKGFACTINE